jgi:hypothetical protein
MHNEPPMTYLRSCKEAAATRRRTIYIYWSPETNDWRSTIHITMVPHHRSFTMVTPGGTVRSYGPV